jgi:predicted transcriptional regulator
MAKPKKLDPENPAPVVDDENAETTAALHAYQDALVRKGLEDMRRGRVVSHEEVVRRLAGREAL